MKNMIGFRNVAVRNYQSLSLDIVIDVVLHRYIANHIVKEKRLGLPKSARESLDLLSENSIIQPQTARRMKNMIGFRNVAVRNYQSLSLDIVIDVVLHRLEDFKEFLAEVDNDSD